MDLGAYDFLMKPIKIEALVEKMKEAVEQSMSVRRKINLHNRVAEEMSLLYRRNGVRCDERARECFSG